MGLDYFSSDYNRNIENSILGYLQGWVVYRKKEQEEVTVAENNPQSEDDDGVVGVLAEDDDVYDKLKLQSTKTICRQEIRDYWNKTILIVEDYLQLSIEDIDDTIVARNIQNSAEMWCAGLLWKKYNLRVIDQEDQTGSTGYGDRLISSAKDNLRSYQYFRMAVF